MMHARPRRPAGHRPGEVTRQWQDRAPPETPLPGLGRMTAEDPGGGSLQIAPLGAGQLQTGDLCGSILHVHSGGTGALPVTAEEGAFHGIVLKEIETCPSPAKAVDSQIEALQAKGFN